MTRGLLTAAWITFGGLIAAAAGLPWLVSEPTRLAGFVNRLLPELDADVTIGRASIGWSGPIVIEDVHVLPKNGAAEPLSIARIEGSHGLAKMLFSFGDLGVFRVQGLDLHVVFRPNHTSNLTGLFIRPPRDPDEADTSKRGRRLSPIRVRLDVEDAVARIDGPWSGEPWSSDPIDVRASLAPSTEGPWSEWKVEPVQLLSAARLEPNVAQGLLAYIAPVLAGAPRTTGLFSLRLDGGRFPVGDPAGGTFSGMLSMHEIDVGPGSIVRTVVNGVPVGLGLPESIRLADDCNVAFRMEHARVWHEGLEFGIPLAQPGRRLDIHSSGSVGVEDLSLDLHLKLPLPVEMPAGRPVLQALAGKTVSVGIAGTLLEPRVVFDGSIRAVAGQVIDELLGGRGGIGPAPRPIFPRRRAPAGPGPNQFPQNGPQNIDQNPNAGVSTTADAPSAAETLGEGVVDLVGGVVDAIARRRAERASLEQDAGEASAADAAPRDPPLRPIRERIRARREARR